MTKTIRFLEEQLTFVARRAVYETSCILADCPYCLNQPSRSRNPTRKCCWQEFRLLRAEKADEEKPVPARLGKPSPIWIGSADFGLFYFIELEYRHGQNFEFSIC